MLPGNVKNYALSRVANTTKFNLNFQKVLDEYKAHGNEFLLKVLESSKYLEEVTGIDEMENIDNDVSRNFNLFALNDSEMILLLDY